MTNKEAYHYIKSLGFEVREIKDNEVGRLGGKPFDPDLEDEYDMQDILWYYEYKAEEIFDKLEIYRILRELLKSQLLNRQDNIRYSNMLNKEIGR